MIKDIIFTPSFTIKLSKMKSVIINNSKGLASLFDAKCIHFEVIRDGWKIKLYYTDEENLLEIGKVIGANLPDLVPTNEPA